MKIAFFALALCCTASSAIADPAGLRVFDLAMPHHSEPVVVSYWYPNGEGGTEQPFAHNHVFEGVSVAIDAAPSGDEQPVVAFSHGMGGTIMTQAWLAAGLAERGAIVVAVNHPNSSWGDFDMREGVEHWTRAADLSGALDALLSDADFEGRVDRSRIMAAGFSFGGWTALSMGGVRGNHAGIVANCQLYIEQMEACDLLLSDDVQMQALDPAQWNASYADERVTHVAAIDPGFVWGLEASNVENLNKPTLLVGFGGEDNRMLATDFDASGLAELLPQADVLHFDPAFHFTAMPLCKPGADAFLEADGDDPVCTDPLGTDRAQVHAAIIDAIAAQLGL